jgi:hypothetical protein
VGSLRVFSMARWMCGDWTVLCDRLLRRLEPRDDDALTLMNEAW